MENYLQVICYIFLATLSISYNTVFSTNTSDPTTAFLSRTSMSRDNQLKKFLRFCGFFFFNPKEIWFKYNLRDKCLLGLSNANMCLVHIYHQSIRIPQSQGNVLLKLCGCLQVERMTRIHKSCSRYHNGTNTHRCHTTQYHYVPLTYNSSQEVANFTLERLINS